MDDVRWKMFGDEGRWKKEDVRWKMFEAEGWRKQRNECPNL